MFGKLPCIYDKVSNQSTGPMERGTVLEMSVILLLEWIEYSE